MSVAPTTAPPQLPTPHGPLSKRVCESLREEKPHELNIGVDLRLGEPDPYGRDLQLALSVCYELHYRGFADVDPAWEWSPALLSLRASLERTFFQALHRDVGVISPDCRAVAEMDALSVEPVDGRGLSYYLRDDGTWEQMREFFVHRSLYHLKEGDPHAWAIPRLTGQAKASFVAVEFDEYGAGRGAAMHQRLFADLMAAADLNPAYLHYLDHVPAESLTAVNLMSLLGLHRSLRGAAVGHFASTEITSPPGSRRLVDALERMGAPEACVAFYREHVEADAVHEQVVRTDVVGDLIVGDPGLERDVVFGIRARGWVEDRLDNAMLASWQTGQTSLRRPLT